MSSEDFEYESIPIGYYDQVFLKGLRKNRGLQFSWHYLKFNSVKDTFPKYETHLDVACGPGTFIGNFLDNRSVGVDIAEKQISYAKNNYPEFKNQFYQKDVNIEIEDLNKYDVITLLEFIEHISPIEVEKLINKLMKKLTKKGRIIITTPNYKGLWLTLEKCISIIGKVDYRSQHINRYTQDRIKEEFKYKNVTVKKYINFGIFMSFFSKNLGFKAEKIIAKLFNNFFGYSLIVIIENE